ncbi:MAG TPA: cation:proton antiporter, partial [Deinococcales bacterium]|nr:cation:proton antiporter [Deinococcales bacterium]
MPPVDALSGGLLATGLLLLASLAAGRLGGRLGLPALLLFLVIGMLAGSDGPGGIAFENYALTQALGSIALVFILFNAGLETRWADTRPVLLAGLSLSTLGVLVTAAIVGAAAHWAAGLPWTQALLLGAIVAPTDASAVFSVLKARALNLKGRIRPLLEFESGINDPGAVVLVTGLANLATHPDASPATLAGSFAVELVIGALVGLAVGRLAVPLARNFPLPLEGLHSVLSAAIALTTFGLAATLHGSGFLAVYLAALVLAN